MTARRAVAFLWAFFTLPIVLGALVLFVVAITLEGRLFAIATITLILAPSVAAFAPRARRLVGSIVVIGLLSLVACIVRAPTENDGKADRAQVHFLNGTHHSKFSPATLVPEADQQILGTWLFGTVDPLISAKQAKQLRHDVKDLYGQFLEDEDLRNLPSTLGFAYTDLFLGSHPVGNLFCYVPEKRDNVAHPFPVVLFLHGSLGNFQAYWVILKQLADTAGVAIVAPSFGAGNWNLEGGTETVAYAVRFCRDDPRLDADHIHLAALSNGGMGLTRTAAESPDDFTSLILLSAVTELPVIDHESFRNGWRDRPVLLITGDTDKRIPAAHQREAEARMRTAGIHVESHYLRDADHFLFFTHRTELLRIVTDWLAR